MYTLELVLNMLAEATTTELSKTIEPKNFDENRDSCQIKRRYINPNIPSFYFQSFGYNIQ